MATRGTILLSAGGTGGHLFPAEALAHEMRARGWAIHLATDERATRFAGRFPAEQMHIIASATPAGRNPVTLLRTGMTMATGYRQSRRLLREIRPAAAVGFGGYPTLPPLLAAAHLRVPLVIHEANAVMGRANRLLYRLASAIALSFPPGPSLDDDGRRLFVTGNPVRPSVIEASAMPYRSPAPDEPFELVVFGGSQGAQFFSQTLPAAIGRLPEAERARLRVTQQARGDDADDVARLYRTIGVEAEVAAFFDDLAGRLARAHFVISRAGASTVSELAVIGRPALLIPYPHALDHDQAMNAKSMADAGGAVVQPQREVTPASLAELIGSALSGRTDLAAMAAAARSTGLPDATKRLADCVESTIAAQSARERQPA